MKNKIFGPIISRRLGISLGIDLLPYKTCDFNCIYCECGKTTDQTIKRENFFDPSEIISQIDESLKKNKKIDYLTFAGSGEPCLYKDLNLIINHVKKNYKDIKLCMITNSSLLTNKDVFSTLLNVDLLLPSVDSVFEDTFKKLNRPCEGLVLKDILEALKKFSFSFKGKIWLEVFFCKNINDSENELKSLSQYIKKIKVDKVQINSLDRPGVEDYCKPCSMEDLEKIKSFFIKHKIDAEIILRSRKKTKEASDFNLKNFLETISRRPLTLEDIVSQTSINKKDLKLLIEKQLKDNIIEEVKIKDDIFYKLNKNG
jgi:wyosine [tRNA(Phe)-imidazoG37] synthetase (radical SAM superfamily)